METRSTARLGHLLLDIADGTASEAARSARGRGSDIARALLPALAAPLSFPARAAEQLAEAIGAAGVEIHATEGGGGGEDGPRLRLLACHPQPSPLLLQRLSSSDLARALSGPGFAPVPLGGPRTAAFGCPLLNADGSGPPLGLLAVVFDQECVALPDSEGETLAEAARVVATGLSAFRSCASETIAAALCAEGGDPAAAARAAAAAFNADRCLVLGAGGPSDVFACWPPAARDWALPPEVWEELAAGRPVRAAGGKQAGSDRAASILARPVLCGSRLVGAVAVGAEAAGRWGDAESGARLARCAWAFAPALATLAGAAPAPSLAATLHREARNAGLLAGIVREISVEVDCSVERLFCRSAELVGKAFGVDRCCFWRYTDNGFQEEVDAPQVVWTQEGGVATAPGGLSLGRASSRILKMIQDSPSGVLVINDVRKLARTALWDVPGVPQAAEALPRKATMTCLGAFRGEVQLIVSVDVLDRDPDWGPEEERLLRQAADQLAVAISHGRLLDAQRTHAAELEQQLMHSGLLAAMTKEIHQVLGVQEVFRRSARLVREAFRASRVRLTSMEEAGLEAVDADPRIAELYPIQIQSSAELVEMQAAAPTGENNFSLFDIYKRLRNTGRKIFAIRDMLDADELARLGIGSGHFAMEFARRQNVRSICFALTSFQGEVNGIIGVAMVGELRDWRPADVRLLETVAEQIGVAIKQSRLLRAETEQRELLAAQNAALEEARREADAASTAKSQFLAMVSHEIRTPMNALCNMSEFLLETELTPQQRDFCATIRNSSVALLNILKDILDTSRLEFNKVEIQRGPVPLRDLFEQVADLMYPSAAQKGIDLTWHVARECPASVYTDAARLNQVLVNLLGNGVKFTQRGEVSLLATATPGALLIAIRDTGIGIPPGAQEKLFSWFYQADSSHSREYGGTGLGLFISRKLAGLMGGELRVESAPGRGSTFFLTFPLAALRHDAEGAPRPPSPAGPPPLAGRRVAILSPSPATRALLRDALEDAGALVAAHGSDPGEGGEGPQGGPPPACLVLDAAALEEAGTTPSPLLGLDVPRIVLASGLGAGGGPQPAAAVLPKPAKPAAVVEAVAAALGRPPARPARGRRGSSESERPSPLRILVAEDVEVNKKILLLMLRKRGYADVEAVSNGAEALSALASAAAAGRPFQCLLLDVMMPVMDGLTAARRIRTDFAAETRPYTIALTANAMAGDREQCLLLMDDYLSKPLRAEALRAALAKCEAAVAARPQQA